MRRRRADLDVLLKVVENPIRRKILYKLVKEAHYPLQLSKELKISQQAITKHLKALEEAGVVESYEMESTAGPPRTYYMPNKQFSIRIDLGPCMFDVGLKTFEDLSERITSKFEDLDLEYQRISKAKNSLRRLSELSNFIKDINGSIQELEEQRMHLCQIKQKILEEAHNIIGKLDDYHQRSILYVILGEGHPSIRELSEEVDLREEVVEDILKQLSDNEIVV
ncbi:MAG: helix-turn-helix domain-containing protein [Halobacteriota archaeon]|nr:helix-turn-helix domain-containing protein [Halobacteriota archaeon]